MPPLRPLQRCLAHHSLRPFRPRFPTLKQQLRHESTTTTSAAPLPAQPSTPKPPPNYRRRALLWSLLALTLGLTTGATISHTIAPPALPEPGSHGDALLLADLDARIDAEFKVRVLRGKVASPPAALRGETSTWVEIPTSLEIASREEGLVQQAEALGLDYADGEGRMTRESMAGARALGVERVFWNRADGEVVAVVWFGGAVAGWPGVTHGGAIAAVLSEKAALAGQLFRGTKEGERERVMPCQLGLTYRKPTYANAFYVVRVRPRLAVGTVLSSAGQEIEVEGTLEAMNGVTCVEMTAVVPVAEDVRGGIEMAKKTITKGGIGSWFGR